MSELLVTGGAGYIGSHMVKMLLMQGHNVTVFDNLSRGFRDAVMVKDFVKGDLCRPDDVKSVFARRHFDAVLHFAALAYVGESVIDPQAYYVNNVAGSLNLLKGMREAGVKHIVFSSTCATYGIPDAVPIVEDHPQNPINPYGFTKLVIERMLADYASAYGINSISLRYFNAAGCDPDADLGERHNPETHLIPLVLLEALRVKQGGMPEHTKLNVFGNDFDTPDGTCVRDYIHVTDLCRAHLAALDRLTGKSSIGAEAYNLGNGNGYSVQEVIDSCSRVTGIDIPYHIAPKRKGDPALLIGSADKAGSVLGWQPVITSLDEMIATAWRFMLSREDLEFSRLLKKAKICENIPNN